MRMKSKLISFIFILMLVACGVEKSHQPLITETPELGWDVEDINLVEHTVVPDSELALPDVEMKAQETELLNKSFSATDLL